MVIDEIHTPDSSRFWYANSYEERFQPGLDPESFDKEYVRRFLAKGGFTGDGPIPHIPDEVKIEAVRRYIEAVERITGETFTPNLDEPGPRIQKNLTPSWAPKPSLLEEKPHAGKLGFVVGQARTPIGSYQGALSSLSPRASALSRSGPRSSAPACRRSTWAKCYMGNVLSAGIGQARRVRLPSSRGCRTPCRARP